MSVTNYSPEKCRYTIDKLVNAVYLVSENAVKDIRIDNGAAYVNSISETPIKLECYGLTLSEEESLDERYKFIHTLKFSVNGYANKDDFQGRYYVIVRDYEGTWWLVNPLFPCKVAYTYTLGYQQNHTEFNIGTASNHPVLKLNGMSDTSSYQCNEYWLSGIDKLWLNEKKYSVHSGSSIKYTNDGFKEVEYNKSSAVFTESFDGENTSHQIDFDVLFSDYKSSWHYNLLEFKDNLYAAIIKTTDGKYALCGFSFGLQPGYTVSADDTVTTGNKIQITLQDAHDAGDAIEMFDNISPIPVSSTTWEYTFEHDGYECVGDGVAKYLLQKEIDALGNETGNYKALDGYENSFPGLNIVCTFDSVVTFARNECLIKPCMLSTSIPSIIEFNKVENRIYSLNADSNWTITYGSGLTVTPDSGVSETDYVVRIGNLIEPTDSAWTSNIIVNYCNGSEYAVAVTVKIDENACFTKGLTYNISANEQTLTIPVQCCIKSIKQKTGVEVIVNIYNTYITVYVPENNTGANRSIVLLVEYCDDTTENVTINQSNIFEVWKDDHEICENGDKYMLQYKYTGTTSSSITGKTEETREILVEYDSYDCKYTRWVQTEDTVCLEDEGTTILTRFEKMSNTNYVCLGFDKYYKEVFQYSLDGGHTWVNSDPLKIRTSSDVMAYNSTDCGYVPPQPVFSDEYLTFTAEEDCYFKLMNVKNGYVYYSLDSGETWQRQGSSNIGVTSGNTIMWKGDSISFKNYYTYGRFTVEGNVMSLLYGDNFSGQTSMSGSTFEGLFSGSTGLTSAENLVLPATSLSYGCYQKMFYGCTGLIKSPTILPAVTLEGNCYYWMFHSCISLTAAPQLPATTLGNNCYLGMFQDCISLTTAPVLPATNYLASGCYYSMFKGCNNLNYIKAMFRAAPGTTYTTSWVDGVANSGTFVMNSTAQWNTSTTSCGIDTYPCGWTVQETN